MPRPKPFLTLSVVLLGVVAALSGVPAQTITENSIGTKANGTISGVVTSGGVAIKGAVITAGSAIAYSNAQGGYSLSLTPGTYTVRAAKPGLRFSPSSAIIAVTNTTKAQSFTATQWTGDGVVRYWAVSVGIEKYRSINNLTYCVDDAQDMTAALKAGGYPAGNLKQLLDAAATKAAIKSAIAWMAGVADADDVCVYFQSSHGDQGPDVAPLDEGGNKDEYLCTYDTGASYTSQIRDDEFGAWMAALKTKKYVVLLDTCFAGGQIKNPGRPFGSSFTRAITGASVSGAMNPKDLDDLGSGVVVTSCTDTELSEEDDALKNGVFAYYLVQGMNNGKADTNKNGRYSAEEIFNYAKGPVHLYNSDQTLMIYDGYAGQLDFAKAKTATAVPSLLAVSGTAAATPAGGSAFTITLSAPATVSVSIVNLAGREVAALGGQELGQGLSTLLWSGQSKQGTRVPAGQYLARVTAAGAGGNTTSCLLSVRK